MGVFWHKYKVLEHFDLKKNNKTNRNKHKNNFIHILKYRYIISIFHNLEGILILMIKLRGNLRLFSIQNSNIQIEPRFFPFLFYFIIIFPSCVFPSTPWALSHSVHPLPLLFYYYYFLPLVSFPVRHERSDTFSLTLSKTRHSRRCWGLKISGVFVLPMLFQGPF